MPTPADARDRASATYNAASDFYDTSPLGFWSYFGQRTIERLQLRNGDHILDVASGTGASALPAAKAVAPDGTVLAVDLAEKLLALARAKAIALNLNNIRFEQGDLMALDQPDAKFDAVICVFGIFFVPDMVAATRELWRMVRSGGKIAITTWAADLFEPGNTIFWNSIHNVRPDLERQFNPWDRISEPTALQQMLQQADVTNVEVEIENRLHRISGPDDWWAIVCGTGYRGTLEQLNTTDHELVRQFNYEQIQKQRVRALQTNAIYAIGKKRAFR